MANDWKIVRFEEIKAESKNAFSMGPFGSKIKAENFKLQGVPVLKGGNLSGIFINEDSFDYLDENKASELKASTAVRGDIVITHRGTLGQVGIIPHSSKYEKYIASQSQLKLSFNRELVDPNFIYYFLKSPEGQSKLLANKSQVGVPAIAQALTSVKSIEINLPSLIEQKRIADFLINIDYFLLNLMESNQILEMLARTIFKSWFINFDPVHAKAAGQEPEGLSAEIAALFPSEFEESELGLIPKGWRVCGLEEFAHLNQKSWSKTEHPDRLSYLDLSSVKKNNLDKPCVFLFEEAPSRARRVLRKGDSIFGTVRPGNMSYGYISNEDESLTGSTGFAVLTPKREELRAFVYCCMTDPSNIERLTHQADGAAYPAVNPSVVLGQELVTPDHKELFTWFGKICNPLFEQIGINRDLSINLTSLRDELLPRLISGKIRIEEAEEALADVMPLTEKQVA